MNVKKFVDDIRIELAAKSGREDWNDVKEIVVNRAVNHEDFKDCSIGRIKEIVERTMYSVKSDVSVLQPYIDDEKVSEIMVNGYKNIFIEKNGEITAVKESFFDTEELEEVIRRVAGNVHREINELNPIVDARLADGSRVNAVYKNIALGGPILTIRKFPEKNIEMAKLVQLNTITEEAALFLKKAVEAGYNFFISGGTSSGKTTFLNAMAALISPDERVVVIEDSAELKIDNIPNLVRMECRDANVSGYGKVAMDDLIKTSLRMRPDRIIIGEIRDGKALLNMLNGLNTGHSGMCTGHGNSTGEMIKRMEALYMQESNFPLGAIDSQIAEGIDIIIHLSKMKDASRKVMEISELYMSEGNRLKLNPLFIRHEDTLEKTENTVIKTEKWQMRYGYEDGLQRIQIK